MALLDPRFFQSWTIEPRKQKPYKTPLPPLLTMASVCRSPTPPHEPTPATSTMDSVEKTDAQQHERTGAPITMDPVRRVQVEKSLKRKLDARCSVFILLYIMNYLDRNNIAAARLKGLQADLNLSYNQ